MTNKVVVVGCGGFGCNLAQKVAEATSDAVKRICCVDSSDSNMRNNVMDLAFYRTPDTDGGGKDRGINIPAFRKFVPTIFPNLPETEMAILVYSTSGGSGSVLGPLLAHEYMQRGIATINVILATTESKDTTENTINTLKTLSNIAKANNRPAHIVVEEKNDEFKASDIDLAIVNHIQHLMRIKDGNHSGLDSKDIENWLNHTRHGITPSLTLIERFDDIEALSQFEGVINRLSLIKSLDTVIPDLGALNNCEGILEDQDEMDMHFITSTKAIDRFRKSLDDRQKYLNEKHKALNANDAFGDSEGDDFLVI